MEAEHLVEADNAEASAKKTKLQAKWERVAVAFRDFKDTVADLAYDFAVCWCGDLFLDDPLHDPNRIVASESPSSNAETAKGGLGPRAPVYVPEPALLHAAYKARGTDAGDAHANQPGIPTYPPRTSSRAARHPYNQSATRAPNPSSGQRPNAPPRKRSPLIPPELLIPTPIEYRGLLAESIARGDRASSSVRAVPQTPPEQETRTGYRRSPSNLSGATVVDKTSN